jgi:hypothetical protein
MTNDFAPELITAGGAFLLAALTYFLSKRNDRIAELRREKLSQYREFVSTLSGVIAGEGTSAGHKAFAMACNNLHLVAPKSVLLALHLYQDEISLGNPSPDAANQERLRSTLLREIRKDLGLKQDDLDNVHFRLWASGIRGNGH